LALRGMPLPIDAPAQAWIFLPISGLVGFVIADYFLFNAYILISSRVTVLFQALTPLFTALLGFLVLGERMRPERILAMTLVVAGIVLVVGSRNAATRAAGLVLSKLGLGAYDAVSGTQIRVMAAVLGFGLQAVLLGRGRAVFAALKDRYVARNTAIGSVFGPFFGVVLSLFALQNTNAGAASTLMALTPILIIPPSILILKQRVRPLEILGAAIAVGGAALFFWL
jgi:drug/metabolite transporter (DMT)-like permease